MAKIAGTLSIAKKQHPLLTLTNKSGVAAVMWRLLRRNARGRYDLIGIIFKRFKTNDFLGSNFLLHLNSIFIAVKSEEAKKIGGPEKFIDKHNAKKRSSIPKKYCA
jgi:hypothetical protein